ncbi:ATP-binding cassette domain-containing protein [Rhizobium sp. TRM96647]|uniref:ABC-F family ATP-binding cassette domain-containing protein n=1 Tax=unclassified Rhizobium TaxID=2613769 RepID=UPI0021E77C45|nr:MULTISPECIES: ABC-F family ATP-binding cassette domain-containing protein [unclassified Rhizobium]MCV3738729.1 ATP-binding cassette domain-containing protein [Rhizobium sp. TRM96647]MCV3760416.1 ATP-binding cassette domain-containing protein [Rhizobium sp. TRM96650]
MSSISLSGLSWTKPDGSQVFADLDLTFGRERVGLVGRNGVGKTTLLSIIAGLARPSAGAVVIDGPVALARQMHQVDANETVADLFGAREALAVLGRAQTAEASVEELVNADWTIDERIFAALARLGLEASPDTLLTQLSGGQRTRAGLAAAMFSEPDFLLLDEPTNNLDRDGRRAVIDLLAGLRTGAIVVSHDRELLEHMDAIVEMSALGARRYGGNWSSYQAIRAVELDAAEQDLAHALNVVDAIDQKTQIMAERHDRRAAAGARSGAKGDMARILLGRRKSNAEATRGKSAHIAGRQRTDALDAAAAAKSRIEVLQPLAVRLLPVELPAGREVLSFSGVTAGYDPARPIIRNLTFSIVGPERLSVAGRNGAGKTTLLKLVTGEILPFEGTVTASVPFAMLDQSISILDRDQTILDNFKRLHPGASENACRATLASFRFRADAARQQVGALSGGQVLRAGLACVLGGINPPSLLILDEPTNHLDVKSIEAVEAGLLAYDGALLIVSHDETFLAKIGIDRRIELAGS